MSTPLNPQTSKRIFISTTLIVDLIIKVICSLNKPQNETISHICSSYLLLGRRGGPLSWESASITSGSHPSFKKKLLDTAHGNNGYHEVFLFINLVGCIFNLTQLCKNMYVLINLMPVQKQNNKKNETLNIIYCNIYFHIFFQIIYILNIRYVITTLFELPLTCLSHTQSKMEDI